MLTFCWIAYLVVLAILALYGLHRLWLTISYWRSRRAVVSTPELPAELPTVTVQLPLFNELYVAERLIDAVAELDWPRDKLEIQILDDSTDETTALCRERARELRAEGFDVVHLHRRDRRGFKAGALQAGLDRCRGELILVLDADFLPPRDLLRKVVGHFRNPKTGMVQVRWEHLNREFSTLTRIQALLLDGHFVVEQSVRSRTGRFFNFNGTAGIWRREAIASAGGWHCDTLTEDLDLSYRALLAGWRFEYLVGLAAPAELPVHMNAFKSQQFRWAKGSIEVARKLLPRVIRAQVPFRVKLEAFFHLTQNVPYLLTLLLVLLVVPVLAVREWHYQPWLDLPLLLGTTGVLAGYCLTSQRELPRDGLLRVLLRLPVLVAVTAGISANQTRAVLEGAFGRRSEFVRTPKHGITAPGQAWLDKKYRGLRSLMPLAELALAAYLLAAFASVVWAGRWTATPILAVFAAGFLYVGTLSLARR